MSDRLTFQEACQELQLTEGELEQLVAEGKIASVKDGDTLFFKREAIDGYKNQQDAEPTMLLSDDEINLLDEGDDIDFGIDLDEPAAAPAGGGGDDVDETVLSLDGILDEDEGTTPVGGGGLLEDDDSSFGDETLLDTDVLDLGDDDQDTFDLETAEDTLLDSVEEGTLLRGGGARVMQMKRKKSHAAWTAVLAVSAFILLAPMSVLTSTVYRESSQATAAGSVSSGQSYDWIKKYGGYFKNSVESLAGMFE